MKLWIAILLGAGLVAEEPKPLPSVSPALKLMLREAQLASSGALAALLQSPAYLEYQRANALAQSALAEAEKAAGCKIDAVKAECLPEKPKPETK